MNFRDYFPDKVGAAESLTLFIKLSGEDSKPICNTARADLTYWGQLDLSIYIQTGLFWHFRSTFNNGMAIVQGIYLVELHPYIVRLKIEGDCEISLI